MQGKIEEISLKVKVTSFENLLPQLDKPFHELKSMFAIPLMHYWTTSAHI